MTDLERLGRALCESLDGRRHCGACVNDCTGQAYTTDARALLQELRNPSFEALDVGAFCADTERDIYANGGWTAEAAHKDVQARWQAMIDHILSEAE